MRYFAITTISSFAILSATALCAAHAAVNTGISSFSGVRIELARETESRGRENQPNDRRGKANDRKTGAAASEQLLAREKEAGDDRGKHSGKHGAASSEQMAA